MRTGVVVCATTAAATLPCRCPTSPLRRCGPSTTGWLRFHRLPRRCPSTPAPPRWPCCHARNPAFDGAVPWAAVLSAARRTSVAWSASKCLSSHRRESHVDRLPHAHHEGVVVLAPTGSRPVRSRTPRVRTRRSRTPPGRRTPAGGIGDTPSDVHGCRWPGAGDGRPDRMRANRGGEYHAGRSPSRNSLEVRLSAVARR